MKFDIDNFNVGKFINSLDKEMSKKDLRAFDYDLVPTGMKKKVKKKK
jgi:hypothetical protein